ncbi:MAG: ABC transporter permease, partial [Rubrivivax sp.]
MNSALPRWADVALLPLLTLGIALLAAGAVVALVGQDPLHVMGVLLHGAFGTPRGLSYTLYYATTFIFTGLAVAVAFHSGLFNIGGEGQ